MNDRPGMFETRAEAFAWLGHMALASLITMVALYGLARSAWDVAHMANGAPVELPQIPQHVEFVR